MLGLGVGIGEQLLRPQQRVIDVGLAARGHARDEILGGAFVPDRDQRHDVVRLRIESDHREPMLFVQQIERCERRRFRHLDLNVAHARRAIDQQHQIQILPLALGLELDGQQPLDFGVGIAASAVRVLAGREQQAAAVAHERLQAPRSIRRQRIRPHVAQDDGILVGKQLRLPGQVVRARDRDADALRSQGIGQTATSRVPTQQSSLSWTTSFLWWLHTTTTGKHFFDARWSRTPFDL